MEFDSIKTVMMAFSISLPRTMAVFILLPILGKKMLGNRIIRNGVVFSFTLFLCPAVIDQIPAIDSSLSTLLLIISKETVIGLVIGYCATVPFWIAEATGFLIDNQRGATMASALNPALETQSSPLGILLTQGLVTLFFTTGGLLVLMGAIYKSYTVWPIAHFYPQFSVEAASFLLTQFSTLIRLTIVLAAPIVIAMFLAEFGLALISRFAPQLNVFSLSMPIKSAVGGIILLLYYGLLMDQLTGPMLTIGNTIEHLLSLMDPPAAP